MAVTTGRSIYQAVNGIPNFVRELAFTAFEAAEASAEVTAGDREAGLDPVVGRRAPGERHRLAGPGRESSA